MLMVNVLFLCIFIFRENELQEVRGLIYKSSWSKEGLKEYYESYKDEKDADEFELSEWLYNDTYTNFKRFETPY